MDKRYRTALPGGRAFALVELHRGGITNHEHLALILNLDPKTRLDLLGALAKARAFVRAKRRNFGEEIHEPIRRKVRCRTCNSNVFMVPCCVCGTKARYAFDPDTAREEHVTQILGYEREASFGTGPGRRRHSPVED